MAHFKGAKTGQQIAKARYADGGGVMERGLRGMARDAKDDLEGEMRSRASEISNPSGTESATTYAARRRLQGDAAFDVFKKGN